MEEPVETEISAKGLSHLRFLRGCFLREVEKLGIKRRNFRVAPFFCFRAFLQGKRCAFPTLLPGDDMLNLINASKLQGGRALFSEANFQANPGDRIGLVGPNGSGKTTLFRIINKEEGLDEGEVGLPSKTVVGYFSQSVAEMEGSCPLDQVLSAAGFMGLREELTELEAKLCEELDEDEMVRVLEKYGDVQAKFDAAGGYELETRAEVVLTGLGIGAEDQKMPLESFSGGWKMRVALACVLVRQPDLLLMDEPTNHLDLESIVWLEEWLTAYPGTLILTSHDREFMNRAVNKIIEIRQGKIQTYGGNYDFYEKEREIRAEQQAASHRRQQVMLEKEKEFIARFKARASHAAQVQSRVKKLEKIDLIEAPSSERTVKFQFQTPPRSGDEVVKFEKASKTWTKADGREVHALRDVNFLLQRLNRLAVVGVNGAGKSTLLKLMAKETEPTSGEVKGGASIEMGYFSQNSLDILDPSVTVLETLTAALPHMNDSQIRTLCGCFLFSGDEADKKVSVLSGGERSRVVLATLLGRPINFLVLDEPTNHLDIQSREILMNALKEFEGTLVVVSHDRHFLREVTNRTALVDGGKVRLFEGGYAEFLASSQGDTRAR
jgi:ATP-binding cassette, subfamily F, member 3